MKKLKISSIWSHGDVKYSLFTLIIKNYFNIQIEWTSPRKCDLLILGPYNIHKFYKKLLNKFILNKSNYLKLMFDDFEKEIIFRKNKPITLFYCGENERANQIESDYQISSDFNILEKKNYLRIPPWKEYIDWSHIGLKKPKDVLNARRFGSHYRIYDLVNPQGVEFLSKTKKICCFFTLLNEPRKTFINLLNKEFVVDGFGPAFNKNISNHNSSNFFKKDILKNYFANFCPENSMYPGYYTEKIIDAFVGKTLPISWSDENVKYDFNPKSFINLSNFYPNKMDILLKTLKDDNLLLKFSKEPLLLSEPNLDSEINFVKKIINNFI